MTSFKINGNKISTPNFPKRDVLTATKPTLDLFGEQPSGSHLFHTPASSMKSLVFRGRKNVEYCQRALQDFVSLGLIQQDELNKLTTNDTDIIEALQTIHVATAFGLSLDKNGNLTAQEFVNGEKRITLDQLKQLTSNERALILDDCNSAEEVFQVVNHALNGCYIEKIQVKNNTNINHTAGYKKA